MLTLFIPEARDLLYKTLESHRLTPILDLVFHSGGKPLIFAGAVRDTIYSMEKSGTPVTPRDVDIGILGLDRALFHDMFKSLGATQNRYGGYCFRPNDRPSVDIWRLEDTCGIRSLAVDCNLPNVLRSFVIGLNAIAFDIHTGQLYDSGSIQGIRAAIVDLVNDPLMHCTPTFAAKSLILSLRLSIPLTQNLGSFVNHNIEPNTFWYEFGKAFGTYSNKGEEARTYIAEKYPRLFPRLQTD